MSKGGGKKERETESKVGFRLSVVRTEPDAGLKPTNSNIMT